MEAYVRGLEETWEWMRAAVEDRHDLGERVVLLGYVEARGLGSGVELRAAWAPVCDFQDGLLSRIRVFLDHGEALKAAGIGD
jgi:ketosteroid isomerase-like protein